jgi:hypothetical protein
MNLRIIRAMVMKDLVDVLKNKSLATVQGWTNPCRFVIISFAPHVW